MCYATAATELVFRRLREKHKTTPGLEPHPLDGMLAYVSPDDLTPDDDFLTLPIEV